MKTKRPKRIWVYLRKFRRNLARKIDPMPKHELSDIQRATVLLIRKLIHNDNSDLLISPISGIYHIEYQNVLVRLGDESAHVMNSKYSYYVHLPLKQSMELSNLFRKRMETKTNKIVSVYEKKTLTSLYDLIESIDKLKENEQ